MRILEAGCLAALGLGLAVSSASAQAKYSPRPADLSRFGGWFGSPSSQPIVTKEAPAPGEKPPMTVTQRAVEQDKLMRAYLRRLEVCDRLRDVGQESNDTSLIDEASRLEEMAWKLYQTRSSKLLGVASASADEDPADPKGASASTAEVLMKSSPASSIPPRLRQGGRIDPPSRAEVPASRKEEQQ